MFPFFCCPFWSPIGGNSKDRREIVGVSVVIFLSRLYHVCPRNHKDVPYGKKRNVSFCRWTTTGDTALIVCLMMRCHAAVGYGQ
jgi:hypothetical protein